MVHGYKICNRLFKFEGRKLQHEVCKCHAKLYIRKVALPLHYEKSIWFEEINEGEAVNSHPEHSTLSWHSSGHSRQKQLPKCTHIFFSYKGQLPLVTEKPPWGRCARSKWKAYFTSIGLGIWMLRGLYQHFCELEEEMTILLEGYVVCGRCYFKWLVIVGEVEACGEIRWLADCWGNPCESDICLHQYQSCWMNMSLKHQSVCHFWQFLAMFTWQMNMGMM